jgi:hypothetical protein
MLERSCAKILSEPLAGQKKSLLGYMRDEASKVLAYLINMI